MKFEIYTKYGFAKIEKIEEYENVFLETKKTAIYLEYRGNKHLLSEMTTTDTFGLHYTYDTNYVVVYSRDCMYNQIPLTIEAVYDLVNDKLLKLSKNNRQLFEFAYVTKAIFSESVILQYINEVDLQITTPEEIEEFKKYITGGNSDISKKDVIAFILKEYPIFEKYIDIGAPLTLIQYRKITEAFKDESISFHIMTQALKQE